MSKNPVTRNYKDSLFRMIFREKKELLSLYNAINGSSYDDPDRLVITTIENVLYMGWKNDVSFLIEDILNLYEHQSSWNPNMPLRGLVYICMLYQGYTEANDLDIYSSILLKLPTPRYVVFYNGTRDEPDRLTLHLSDSFIKKDEPPFLECTAIVLNINYGHNRELMTSCRKLYEYSYFIEKVRKYLQEGLIREVAVERAVQHCITNHILKEFLLKHRAEVKQVILTEYDEKKHDRTLIEEGKAQGVEIGKKLGEKTGKRIGQELGKEFAFRQALIHYVKKNWHLSPQLLSCIEAEKRPDVLESWLLFAMDCGSLEKLEEKILAGRDKT